MKKKANDKKTNYGFTIIEVMISTLILILVGVSVFFFQKNIFSLNNFISSDLLAQGEARHAFKSMTNEIRSASPSSSGTYPISEASSTSFTFYVDIDDDGLKERIRYFLENNTIRKGVLKPSINPVIYNPANETITRIIDNVSNGGTPIFQYYDSNYDGTSAPLSAPFNLFEIRLVKIMVSIDENPSQPPAPLIMITQISMRNLKDNL